MYEGVLFEYYLLYQESFSSRSGPLSSFFILYCLFLVSLLRSLVNLLCLFIFKYEALNIWIMNLHVYVLGSPTAVFKFEVIIWSVNFEKVARCCLWRQKLKPVTCKLDPCLLVFCMPFPPFFFFWFSTELSECQVSLEFSRINLLWTISPYMDIPSWIFDRRPEVS